MSKRFAIERDSHNRLRADISDDMAVGIKILAETDPRRMEKGVHGYAVLDVRTTLGPLRIRDIKVMWSETNQRYFLRWRQWPTGKIRDGRKEYLDVVGPLDPDTRAKLEGEILGVFHQVREEASKGTLGRNPETNAKLEALKHELEQKSVEALEVAADA